MRERIDLLAELITIGKDAWMSDVYDETALIIAAIERNARLQDGIRWRVSFSLGHSWREQPKYRLGPF